MSQQVSKGKDITYTYGESDYFDLVDNVSQHPVQVVEFDKTILVVQTDDDPWNPREDDAQMVARMICFHSRYSLGDEHKESYEKGPRAFADWIEVHINRKDIVYLPLYLYDHSGITMHYEATYPYNDRWDAGMVGYMYMTMAAIRENWGIKRVTKKWRQKALDFMKAEIEIYDQYIRGEVYGYTVVCKKCWEIIDSTWGFFGDDIETNGILDEAYREWTCAECEDKEREEE
jgi:hypothetical protein